MKPRLRVQRLDAALPLPRYHNEGDAGLDLYAAQDVTIDAQQRAVIGTGVAVAIPDGFVGLVAPRSGMAARHGLSMVNTPGVVDAGYRGEVKLILVNHDPDETIVIARGDRVAQLVIVPVAGVVVEESEHLPPTERGEGGFGSTGR